MLKQLFKGNGQITITITRREMEKWRNRMFFLDFLVFIKPTVIIVIVKTLNFFITLYKN